MNRCRWINRSKARMPSSTACAYIDDKNPAHSSSRPDIHDKKWMKISKLQYDRIGGVAWTMNVVTLNLVAIEGGGLVHDPAPGNYLLQAAEIGSKVLSLNIAERVHERCYQWVIIPESPYLLS